MTRASRRRRVGTLLLAFCLAVVAACRSPAPDSAESTKGNFPAGAAVMEQAARVAPLFMHGEGTGWDGGAPVPGYDQPLYLNESEASRVIVEELRRYGVCLDEHNVVVDKISFSWRIIRRTQKKDGTKDWDIIPDTENSTSLAMDLADRKKRIAVKFIWEGNYIESGGADVGRMVTVDERTGERWNGGWTVWKYDFPEAARYVRSQIERQGRKPWYYGIFYDPVTTARTREAWESAPEPLGSAPAPIEKETFSENLREYHRRSDALGKALEKARSAARDEAYDLLRAQVRDFAEWLKREGAV